MDFITSEQFLEAENKVQDAIYKWWNPEEGDLCVSNIIDEMCCIRGEITKERIETITGNTTPLLTVNQLIKFIQYKNISVQITLDKDKNPTVDAMLPNNETKKYDIKRYSHTELIYALWELVCEICVLENVDK